MRFVCPDGEEQYRRVVDEESLQAAGHELAWFDGRPEDAAGWAGRLAGADGVASMWGLPPGVLTASPAVRVVSFAGSGAGSYVDLEEAHRLGVTVCNVPAYGANAIAEHAFALAFAVARSIPQGDRLVRSGTWAPGQMDGFELRGRRLGVVGAGPIGARAVELGRALGMDVVAWTRSPTAARAAALGAPFVTLDELFATADVVTLHVAHTPETEGLVGRRLLGLLAPQAILVNTARGQLVDEAALLELLDAGRLRGAGIDAFAQEPLPPGHALLASEKVVLTPHAAFNTPEATAEMIRVVLDNLVSFAAGAPQNVVA